MKTFIFGSNGMLGNYVRSHLSKNHIVIPLTRKDYDLSQLSADGLENLLQDKYVKEGDVVINCAGVIPQSSKQRVLDTGTYFKINSVFPVILGNICEKLKTKMIHITTDCVFSGEDGNYDENSTHDETNDYGMSKSLGDLCKATIIRTSIIGEEVNNKRSLLEWVRSNANRTINGYTNHMWNGVTCLQLAKVIDTIITKELYWTGVRHVLSPRSVSKYELTSIVNEIYNLCITINEFQTIDAVDKTIASRYDEMFEIPDLVQQVRELEQYDLHES